MALKNIGILVSGNGSNLQAIIDAAEAHRIDAQVRVVISDMPGVFALERARRHGIKELVIERKDFPSREAFENSIAAALLEYGADLVCLAGFMRILGPAMLSRFQGKIINIHPALLPSFPGLDAQAKALEHGVKVAGCTVHFVDEKTDHGPIIMQAAVEVKEDDTVASLRERILKEEHRIYPQAIQLLAEERVEIIGRKVIVRSSSPRK